MASAAELMLQELPVKLISVVKEEELVHMSLLHMAHGEHSRRSRDEKSLSTEADGTQQGHEGAALQIGD